MKRYLLLVLTVLLMLQGCTEVKPPVEEEKKVEYYNDKYLKFNIRKVPFELNPLDYNDKSETIITNNVYEGLVREGEDGFSLAMANSYTVKDDYKAYTFRLRTSQWTDGSKVTSEDFAETILRRKEHDAYNVIHLLGIETIETPDEETIVFKLARPNTNFINYLSDPMFLPEKSKNGEVLYNGPYYVENADNNTIRLFKNEGYWNHKEVFVEVVEGVQMYYDEAIKNYENNSLDLVLDIPTFDIPELLIEKDELIVFPQESVFCFLFNEEEFETNLLPGGENIKSHLFEAVDRTAIVENFTSVAMKPETVAIPKDLLEGTDQSEFWSFLDKYETQSASSFVYESGESISNELIEVTIRGNAKDEYEISKLVRDMWYINLGVDTNVLVLDDNKYKEALEEKDFQVIAIELTGIAHDPLSYINIYHSNTASNYGNYTDRVFDTNIQSAYTSGERIRNIYIKKALVNLTESHHVLAICGFDSAVLLSNEFRNLSKTRTGKIYFDEIDGNRKE